MEIKRRTNFKKVIEKKGLEKVLENPFKYLRMRKSCYTKNYLQNLKYRLTKYKNLFHEWVKKDENIFECKNCSVKKYVVFDKHHRIKIFFVTVKPNKKTGSCYSDISPKCK